MISASYTSASWIPWGQRKGARTRRGMILAFKPTASRALADVPARVVTIGPRFRSGDYLVTLEYARPAIDDPGRTPCRAGDLPCQPQDARECPVVKPVADWHHAVADSIRGALS